ncbi:MAG: menaquinone biosynthesis protein [Cyanobacteria bacterium P01_H01_bin.74]
MLRLGAIRFINTIPIYLGIDKKYQQPLLDPLPDFQIYYDVPTALNRAILSGQLDVSPVSSACYLKNQDQLTLLDGLSVSSLGSAKSVLFLCNPDFSPQKMISIAVPDDSETSIALLKHCIQNELIALHPGSKNSELDLQYQQYPAGNYKAALETYGNVLVIGDAALLINQDHEQAMPNKQSVLKDATVYDLSSLWVQNYQTPFVFAVWVARREWAVKNPVLLEKTRRLLCNSRDDFFIKEHWLQQGVALAKKHSGLQEKTIRHYFTAALNYQLTALHYQSLHQFDKLLNQGSVKQKSEVSV